MKDNLNIVFFGTPDFVIPVLKALLENGYNVSGIFAGHGPVELEARKRNIKVFSPTSLKKDEQAFETFKLLNPKLCVVAAYGKILPARYLDIPKYGFINIHPSLLPKYRGPSPIQTAILNGDKETEVAVMLVDAEVDHGPILAEAKYEIDGKKYFSEIARELFELGAKLIIETIPKYITGELKPKKQDHSQATFTKMFTREDSRINWNDPAQEIYNRVRALNPEPGTWTTWKGKVINISNVTMFNIVSQQVINMADLVLKAPGTVKKVDDKIAVATSMGYLDIISVQLEGGKEMDAKSFINGHPDFLNSQLE